MLDHGYAEQYEKKTGKKADWFTTHGDVFPVGSSKMKPFPPVSPDGSPQLPDEAPEQGRRRVEPLLRPRHQRRGPALGQRRGSLRRRRLRAALGLSLPESEGSPSNSRTSGSASCREIGTTKGTMVTKE